MRAIPPPSLHRDVLEQRLTVHGERLRGCLERLYGRSPQFEGWLKDLKDAIITAADARSDELKALDREREADPDWFLRPEIIGYSAYVDRFAGDLEGVGERADYLRGLGVRYLHLLPFWKARPGDSDGGFAVSDYTAVRQGLGDIDDLEPMTRTLRKAGISACVDLVLNHAADDHPWAKAASMGDPHYRAYFHIFDDAQEVQTYEEHLGQVFPQTAPGNFTFQTDLRAWVWTTFYPFQWDLNWANPNVFTELIAIILSLANQGVEAFRLDSAAYLWKRRGTPCRNEPETHLVLQAIRAVVAIAAPAVLLKSEVVAPVAETAEYLGGDGAPECHLAYHSSLMAAGWAALAEGRADLVHKVLAGTPAIPKGAGWITYVRCHDDIGWWSLAPQAGADNGASHDRLKRISDFYVHDTGEGFTRGMSFQTDDSDGVHGLNGMASSLAGLEAARNAADQERAIDRIQLLYGLAFAAGGIPVIFMGDELGQTNDYSFVEDPMRRHDGRWLHRPLFDAEKASEASRAATLPGRLRARLLSLKAARMGLPPLDPESAPRAVNLHAPAVLGFWRGRAFFALFNFSAQWRTVDLPGEKATGWNDLLSGARLTFPTRLKPYGMAWLTREEG